MEVQGQSTDDQYTGDRRDNSSRFRRGFVDLLAFLQLLLGILGCFGIYSYLMEPVENSSRYQLLFIPVWCWIFSLPLLLITAFLYRRCKSELTSLERWLVNVGCALPLLVFVAAVMC